METKIIILIITALFIAWGLCRSKQTDKQKIRKTDFWFLISSLIICIAITCLYWVMHIRVNLCFLLIPAVSMSLMCIYTGRTKKLEEQEKTFTLVEKILLVLLVIFICSGVVDCSLCEYGIRRLTHFYMASMFYKMLGGWILAELVFSRRFPFAQIKSFFLLVLAVNTVRFIEVFCPLSIYRDGTYPLIQMVISFAVLAYMYCRYPKIKSSVSKYKGHNDCIMKQFNRTLIFDFGSSKTVVCENDEIVFDEHTEISIFSNGKVVIGNKARGFYSDYYEIFKPIVEGKVVNYDCFETYVKKIVRKLVRFPRLCLKAVVIAIPSNLIDDKTSLKLYSEPFKKMGVKDIRFIPQCVGLLHGVLKSQQ